MTLQVTSTGLDVPEPVRAQFLEDDVAARLVRKDATLWGPDAESEAAVRLGWLDLPATSRGMRNPCCANWCRASPMPVRSACWTGAR